MLKRNLRIRLDLLLPNIAARVSGGIMSASLSLIRQFVSGQRVLTLRPLGQGRVSGVIQRRLEAVFNDSIAKQKWHANQLIPLLSTCLKGIISWHRHHHLIPPVAAQPGLDEADMNPPAPAPAETDTFNPVPSRAAVGTDLLVPIQPPARRSIRLVQAPRRYSPQEERGTLL